MVVRFVTFESGNPQEYLTQIKIGSASKRWQSAYELSKILSDPNKVPLDDQFKNSIISAFEQSLNDDPKVRMYLALAMGRTGDDAYGESLMTALNDENPEIITAAIQALGLIQYKPSIAQLSVMATSSDVQVLRLASAISLGQIGDKSSLPLLKSLLDDEEANIRWDAAIALAKMGDSSGSVIINSLLSRAYYKNFKEIDSWETEKAILVAIQVTSQLGGEQFKSNLLTLAKEDPNMEIRNAALKTLESVYNMELSNG
ncbi:MAG: HEAT repeat domain-containing protein [Candidatus Marinimicrobia bacterium]|nr:HEAT repeat domain-containing protein [Candidatus Neomarinimicrobiota bacterium]